MIDPITADKIAEVLKFLIDEKVPFQMQIDHDGGGKDKFEVRLTKAPLRLIKLK